MSRILPLPPEHIQNSEDDIFQWNSFSWLQLRWIFKSLIGRYSTKELRVIKDSLKLLRVNISNVLTKVDHLHN